LLNSPYVLLVKLFFVKKRLVLYLPGAIFFWGIVKFSMCSFGQAFLRQEKVGSVSARGYFFLGNC